MDWVTYMMLYSIKLLSFQYWWVAFPPFLSTQIPLIILDYVIHIPSENEHT